VGVFPGEADLEALQRGLPGASGDPVAVIAGNRVEAVRNAFLCHF
jgi:hypothetical protein